jgi:hypothetical protein
MANTNKPGVVVIIADPDKQVFLVQDKTDTHPIPQARAKLSFWGGSIEEGESAPAALMRELFEEIIVDPLVRAVIHNMRRWKEFELSQAEFGEATYQCTVYVSVFPAQKVLEMAQILDPPGRVTEGKPLLLTRSHWDKIKVGRAGPGFMASLDVVLEEFLSLE